MAKKTTKRALFLSVMSLFICFTMLIGTTYAWFTDSVTSTGNIIKTGTLEVTLEYSKELLTDKDSDKWIDASTGAIFNHGNWEPGYTEVRYVKVENEGSLDLKFMLSIIPSEKTADNEPNLADVIDVYIAKTAVSVDRNLTDLILVGTLSDLINDPDGAAYGVLYDKDEAGADTADEKVCVETYTLVLKMQETAGNEYQNRTVGGTFSVQLLATQLANENDDLGTPDYDANATYPTVAKATVPANTTVPTKIPVKGATVEIPVGAPAGVYEVSVSNEETTTDENGNTTDSFDLNMTINGEKATGNYTVERYVGQNLNLVGMTHNGEAIAIEGYDAETGLVKFTANGFSPFTITYYSGVIDEAADLENIAKGGNFVLNADIELAETLLIPEGVEVVLDLNGKTLSGGYNAGSTDRHIYTIENKGTLTLTGDGVVNGRGVANRGTLVVNGGTYNAIDTNGGGAIWNYAGATVTINGGMFISADDTVAPGAVTLNIAAGATAVINGGTFVGQANQTYAIINDGNLTVNDITISSDHGVIATSGTTVLNGGKYQQNGNIVQTSSLLYITDGTTTVNGGVYNFNVDGKLDSGLPVYCAGGSVAISGGAFTGYVTEMISSWGGTGTASVTGGTFEKEPGFVAEGYTYAQNMDGYYYVYSDVDGLEGSGTQEDPYLITSLGDLIWFRDNVNTYTSDRSNQYVGKYVKLTADIDLAGINWEPIGTNSTGDHMAFVGTFDGNGHTISNLYINADGGHLGFFARTGSYVEGEKATVKNLNFVNIDVSTNVMSHWTTGHGDYVGGVIANAGGNTTIENVNISGDIYVAGCAYVGGIVGHGYPTINNCKVVAEDGSYILSGYWSAGAILGYGGESTVITNSSVVGLGEDGLYIWGCYGAAAAICGNARAGAIGENLYASNVEISGDDYGLGYVFGVSGTLTNCSFDNITFPEGYEISDAEMLGK